VFVARNGDEAREKARAAGYDGPLQQDEDVLDTWFSSWLWPFATLGWPNATEDLKEFYPTSLLSTAPDIIFFWVARMIMAGIEFMPSIPMKDGSPRTELKDLVPFRDVYFHNVIRDLQGRKMSKSLGNSPDPLDLIAKYGTDAVRFTLLYLAPLGQDVRFGEESVEIGRNFANKLWNATRFVLMKRDEYQASKPKVQFESEDTELQGSPQLKSRKNGHAIAYQPATTLADKWILSRANRAARDIKEALDQYLINDATKYLYDFIWGDYCDWYLEIVKLQPESTPLAVEILEGILRLLHPIMPFITEDLWHELTGAPADVLIGKDDYITADPYKIDDEIEAQFLFVQRAIEAIRLLRSQAQVPPSRESDVIVQVKSNADLELLQNARPMLERLAGKTASLTIEREGEEYSANDYTSELIGARGQVFLKRPQASSEERLKERERLAKERERISAQLEAVMSKLANESFVARAPEAVIQKEREKQENYRSQLDKLEATLKELAV
jgi:valyl-tRNA synthetase